MQQKVTTVIEINFYKVWATRQSSKKPTISAKFLQNFGKYSTPPSLECDADKMSDKIRNEVKGFQKDDWEM